MSTSWFPDGFELHVENPGHGTMLILGDHGDWETELTGAELGQFLADVTARALGTEDQEAEHNADWKSSAPPFITAAAARRLLPSLQRAVILAGSGTDKFERLFVDPEDKPPAPLCAQCWEGSYYSGYPLGSSSCDQYGHTPFGFGDRTKWETAQQRAENGRQWWDTRRRLGRV